MAFAQQDPRAFTRSDILALNAGQMGVYGIFKVGSWVYVGKGDIRERLLSHLNGDNPCILNAGPTHWVGEVCTDPEMSRREKALIAELQPPCNDRIG